MRKGSTAVAVSHNDQGFVRFWLFWRLLNN